MAARAGPIPRQAPMTKTRWVRSRSMATRYLKGDVEVVNTNDGIDRLYHGRCRWQILTVLITQEVFSNTRWHQL